MISLLKKRLLILIIPWNLLILARQQVIAWFFSSLSSQSSTMIERIRRSRKNQHCDESNFAHKIFLIIIYRSKDDNCVKKNRTTARKIDLQIKESRLFISYETETRVYSCSRDRMHSMQQKKWIRFNLSFTSSSLLSTQTNQESSWFRRIKNENLKSRICSFQVDNWRMKTRARTWNQCQKNFKSRAWDARSSWNCHICVFKHCRIIVNDCWIIIFFQIETTIVLSQFLWIDDSHFFVCVCFLNLNLYNSWSIWILESSIQNVFLWLSSLFFVWWFFFFSRFVQFVWIFDVKF